MAATGEMTPVDPNAGFFGFAPPGIPYHVRPPPKKPKPKPRKIPSLPHELEADGPCSNTQYEAALSNPSLMVSPQTLGFLPSNYWLTLDTTFGDIVAKFFQRKNNANCRFPHKLFNALVLVSHNPALFHFVGVRWVTDRIFKVDKLVFGRLLGIGSVDAGLLHKQGNLPSHGFVELSGQDIAQLRARCDIGDVDQDRIRLFYHRGSLFSRNSTEEMITNCRWIQNPEARA
jgi:hypothetical protein